MFSTARKILYGTITAQGHTTQFPEMTTTLTPFTWLPIFWLLALFRNKTFIFEIILIMMFTWVADRIYKIIEVIIIIIFNPFLE